MIWLITLAAIWLIRAAVNECYNLQVANSRLLIVQQLLFTSLEAGLLYVLAVFVFGHTFALTSPYAPPHLIPVLFLLVSLPLLALWRVGYAHLFTSAPMRRRALIVGAGNAGRALIGALGTLPQDYELIRFVDDDPVKQGSACMGWGCSAHARISCASSTRKKPTK